MSSIHSPFRYPGGKYYARKLITGCLPAHSVYYEPFAGGGSIFFAKAKADRNHLNDADADLIQVYRAIRDTPERLIEFLATTQYPSRESHAFYKNEFVPQSTIEMAGRWYYLNRISYSGIMKRQNCFWGYRDNKSMVPDNWPKTIRAASAKLQSVDITNQDFATVIDAAADGSLLFVDPPYYNADQDKFYSMAFTRECHIRLCEVLRRNTDRLSFLVTYDDCDEIRSMYDWVGNLEANEWTYCLSRSDDQKTKTGCKGTRSKGKEIFIRNYKPTKDDVIAFDGLIDDRPKRLNRRYGPDAPMDAAMRR